MATIPAEPAPSDALEILSAGTAQILPAGALAERLSRAALERRPLRVKLGIDPSGNDLTLGHAVVLRKLRQFQDFGHVAVLIVGDFTGMVGDPTGKSATRSLLTAEETAANSATYFEQVMRILDPDRTEVRRNSEWLATMTMTDVVRESSRLTVARLLERDDFAKRFKDNQPISLVEFLYPLLQGYDSVAVRADVELGGTDQTYNLLVGRELQRGNGQPPQVVLTVPLLEGLDGVEKMSKSLNNYVAISEPPAMQFGKLMSIPDHLVPRYAQLATGMHPREVESLVEQVAGGGPEAGVAKRRVAAEIVALYHGTDAAKAAEDEFNRVHRDHAAPSEVPELPLPDADPVHLPQLLVAAGLAASSSEARRLIDEGAIRVDDAVIPQRRYDIARSELVGATVRRGKRQAARFV
ncbi:MAG: tyrosine--tRNA ligase [Actinomycetota bacterium]